MNDNVHNLLIYIPTTNCTSNRREAFLFVFNSFACTCRNVVGHADAHQRRGGMVL